MSEFKGTAHNSAKVGDIAKTVLMPGDPLRAKMIAEKYLENVVCYNTVRNMLGYTGDYKGQKISVQGSGMGMPSIGIYSYELYNFYGVENIIRVGSTGAMSPELDLGDVVVAQGSSTDSSYAKQYDLPGTIAPIADFGLIENAVATSREKAIPVRVGNVLASDHFYNLAENYVQKWADMGILCVEMEAAALYLNAAKAKKKALCILTVSDHLIKKVEMTPQERELSFNNMIEIALDSAIKIV